MTVQNNLPSIHAYVAEVRELCEPGIMIDANKSTSLRLSELAGAIPMLQEYAAFAETLNDENPILVEFVWRRMGSPLHNFAERLRAYRGNAGAGTNERDNVVNEGTGIFAEVFHSLALALASSEAGAIHAMPGTRRTIAELGAKVEELERDARAALETAQEAARGSGLFANLQAFANAAREHACSAKLWALGALVCAAILLVGGYLQDGPTNSDPWNTAKNLFFFGEHVFLASVVSFLMVTCVRNYRSARHNQVLNDHRTRSLQTFARLRAGAVDDKMRDAILLQATEAIFAMQASGFADGAIAVTHAHELLELVKPSSKG